MSKFEVTQGEYLLLMENNPSYFTGDAKRPVEQVSWNDAVFYCASLTIQERLAGRIPATWQYRLPTEAEWEYACRAGTTNWFIFGNYNLGGLSDYAWYSDTSGSTTHPVGLLQANAWGLYDMNGNVSEWCQDWFGSYPGGRVPDPLGPESPTSDRMIRGGSWGDRAVDCGSVSRQEIAPESKVSGVGFRVVLAPVR